MPRIEEGKEVLSWLIWDSITPGATDVAATLFAAPLGQAGKTLYDTNMRNAGRMPWPEELTFETVRFAADPDATLAIQLALMKGTFSLAIGNKSYLDLRLFELPSGGGVHVVAPSVPTLVEAAPPTYPAGVFVGQSGVPDQTSVYPLSVPLTLDAGETFRVEVTWPIAPEAHKFWIGFDCTLRRAIQ